MGRVTAWDGMRNSGATGIDVWLFLFHWQSLHNPGWYLRLARLCWESGQFGGSPLAMDRVVDTNGNYMEYSYFETHPPSNLPVPAHDLSSYGATISYTGSDVNGTQPGHQVRFVLGNRNQIGDVPTSFNAWDLVDTQYLDAGSRFIVWFAILIHRMSRCGSMI